MDNRIGSKGWSLATAVCLAIVAGALLSWDRGGRSAVPGARAHAGIFYVDARASAPEPDGLAWTTAFTELQTALAAAVSGDQIWVAEGVYKPDFEPGSGAYTGYVTATFALTNGVKLYGGFVGGMDTLEQRRPAIYLTILSGDLADDDQTDARGLITDTARISGANSYHIVTAIGVNHTAVFDGFVVTGGNANGGPPNNVGGGMLNNAASLGVANALFIGNRANFGGGGMVNRNGSAPTLRNVIFDGNRAEGGGGLFNRDGSNPRLVGVVFRNNRASYFGGGVKNNQSHPTLTNVVLSGNVASFNGGGMENYQSSPRLVNVTFNGNAATGDGGGLYNDNSTPTIQNCIFWGNRDSSSQTAEAQIGNTGNAPVIAYTLVQGSGGSGAAWNAALGEDGGGNLDADPQFLAPVDPESAPASGGDLRLLFGSPAMDAGDNAAVLSAVDLDGKRRLVAPAVDMGAYEIEGLCFATVHAADTVLFVYHSTTGIAVQQAVNVASAGDTVKVAGHCRGAMTQTVYIDKNLTLRGGYTLTDWTVSDPLAQPAMLDAAGAGRVVEIAGVGQTLVVLENLRLINGVVGDGAEARGGAVRVADATAIISGCAVVSNTATSGGGIAFTGNSAGRVVNTVLSRNTADEGAALWVDATGQIDVTHTTMAALTTNPASAVYATGGTMRLTNVIIANHAAGIVQAGAATVQEDYTLFSGVTMRTLGSVGGGIHSITGAPRFVAPAHDDYRLMADSAAIDAGTDAGVYVDFQGDPRPMGGGFDIGYDEFAKPTYFTVYLPLVLRN